MKISDTKRKFFEDLNINLDNLPPEFEKYNNNMRQLLSKEELDFITKSNLTGTFIKSFCLKDLVGSDYPDYCNKTFLESFISTKRGDYTVKEYFSNPDYYFNDLKQFDQYKLKHTTPLRLFENNGKFFIQEGNNRLSLIMMKYLAEMSNATSDDQKKNINQKYTFIAEINPIPKDRDIMHMINIIRDFSKDKIRITNISNKEYDCCYKFQTETETVKIQSKQDLENFIKTHYNSIKSHAPTNNNENKNRILNSLFPNLQQYNANKEKSQQIQGNLTQMFCEIQLEELKFSKLFQTIGAQSSIISIHDTDIYNNINKIDNNLKEIFNQMDNLNDNSKINEFTQILNQAENLSFDETIKKEYVKQMNASFNKSFDFKIQDLIKDAKQLKLDEKREQISNEKISIIGKFLGKGKLKSLKLKNIDLKKELLSSQTHTDKSNYTLEDSLSDLYTYSKCELDGHLTQKMKDFLEHIKLSTELIEMIDKEKCTKQFDAKLKKRQSQVHNENVNNIQSQNQLVTTNDNTIVNNNRQSKFFKEQNAEINKQIQINRAKIINKQNNLSHLKSATNNPLNTFQKVTQKIQSLTKTILSPVQQKQIAYNNR